MRKLLILLVLMSTIHTIHTTLAIGTQKRWDHHRTGQ